jgi:hypothetical protein
MQVEQYGVRGAVWGERDHLPAWAAELGGAGMVLDRFHALAVRYAAPLWIVLTAIAPSDRWIADSTVSGIGAIQVFLAMDIAHRPSYGL